jgi:hypothetical protein
VVIAFGCLTLGFVANDFSVAYVAQLELSAADWPTASPRLGRPRGLAAAVGADARWWTRGGPFRGHCR